MQFVTTVCMAAICAALYKLLVPENKFGKQISLLVVCVFLLTGITAVSSAEISFDTDESSIEENEDFIRFSENINSSLKKKICDEMSEKAEKLLNERGFSPKQIRIIVNISGLYGIEITQIQLVFPKGDESAAEAAEYLEGELGIAVCAAEE